MTRCAIVFGRAILCSLMLLPAACRAQTGVTDDAVSLVKGFYDWYVPKARVGQVSWWTAFGDRRFLFEPRLEKALQEDIDAQVKIRGEIVGLDFDPFLDVQDACEGYELGRTVSTPAGVSVEVFAVCQGKKGRRPNVVMEVIKLDSRSVIADIRYEDRDTLLKELDSLRKERSK